MLSARASGTEFRAGLLGVLPAMGAVVAMLALACEPAPPSADAALDAGEGTLDAAPDGGLTSIAVLPAAPSFGVCPEGWQTIDREGIGVCDPWPASGIEECTAPDEAHFAGTPGCARVGNVCPAAGEFAGDLPATGVLFVRAGEPPGGDGTRARPFGAIAGALAIASPGTTVALASGRYLQDRIDLPAGVTLVGACVSGTLLRSDAEHADLGVVTVGALDTGLRNLRIEGRRPGISVGAGGSLTLLDVVVEGAETRGVVVTDGGRLSGARLVVRDTAPFMGFDAGEGLGVYLGGQVELVDAVFERNELAGIDVSHPGTHVTLTNVAVRDTRRGSSFDDGGLGIRVIQSATAEIHGAAIDRNHAAGIASLVDARVVVDDAAIRDVAQAGALVDFGAGVLARAGGRLEASRAWIERASHVGAVAFEPGSELVLRDTLVRETRVALRPEPDRYGIGVGAVDGAHVTLDRTAVLASTFIGVWVQEASSATITDLIVRDTRSTPSDRIYGRAIEAQRGGALTMERVLLERNHDVSVSSVDPGTTLSITDLTIRDTRARTIDDRFGYGVIAGSGASITLLRADVSLSRGMAVAAFGDATRIEGTEVAVADTRAWDCAETSCAGEDFGYAVAAHDGARVRLTEFTLEASAVAALQLASGGEADFSEGLVADSPIGFNVQTSGFDDARLRAGVRFRAVPIELDTSALFLAIPLDRVPPFGI